MSEYIENQDKESSVERMPLWRGVLSEMIESATHGDTLPVEHFEQKLRCSRDTVEFGISVSNIRKGLEHYGMSMTQKAGQMLILLPEDNARVMELFNFRALRSLKRAVILGSSTPLAGLTDSQKREHEKQLSKSAFRLALMRRKTHEIAGTTAPKTLPEV